MLPTALAGDEFRLHYQPLFSLLSGAPTGVEALLRWQHPWLGQIMPDRFIGAAEDIGIIVPLGGWVLETACAQAKRWASRFADPLCVSVNVAMRQLTDPQLIERITRVLDDNDLRPWQLQLELTERAVIGSDREPLAALRALADIGVRIAIDDFGTGYSNMTYLRTLPVSELKLAASFIENLRATGTGSRYRRPDRPVDRLPRSHARNDRHGRRSRNRRTSPYAPRAWMRYRPGKLLRSPGSARNHPAPARRPPRSRHHVRTWFVAITDERNSEIPPTNSQRIIRHRRPRYLQSVPRPRRALDCAGTNRVSANWRSMIQVSISPTP